MQYSVLLMPDDGSTHYSYQECAEPWAAIALAMGDYLIDFHGLGRVFLMDNAELTLERMMRNDIEISLYSIGHCEQPSYTVRLRVLLIIEGHHKDVRRK